MSFCRCLLSSHLTTAPRYRVLRVSCSVGCSFRSFGVSAGKTEDVRARILEGVKDAMKRKDTFASTTLRSVLSDIYAADKKSAEKISSSTITGIIRKAASRRNEAAAQFRAAGRTELAVNEEREALILTDFLPPSLSQDQIRSILQEIFNELAGSPGKPNNIGGLLKAFYTRVEKSNVDPQQVKTIADSLIHKHS